MRLSDYFIDLIAYVSYFTLSDFEKPYSTVDHEISALLTRSVESAEKDQLNMDSFDKAKFAICSWIDETLLESSWKDKRKWQTNLLQTRIFKTSDSGLLFFEKLNQLRPDENEVRAVFFLCVALGFTGMYSLENNEYKFEQLKSINSKLLTGSAMGAFSIEGKTLFPDAYHSDSVKRIRKSFQRKRSYFIVGIFLMPLSIITIMFFLYNFILNSEITSGFVS